jgi:hypothetical protein
MPRTVRLVSYVASYVVSYRTPLFVHVLDSDLGTRKDGKYPFPLIFLSI